MIKCSKINANQRFRVVRSALTYSTFGFLHRRGCRRQLGAFLQWAKANCPFTVSLLLTGSGDNLYRPFSPHFTTENLKNRRRRLKGFTTLLSSQNHRKDQDFGVGLYLFSAEWVGYLQAPTQFKFGAQNDQIPEFRDQAVAPLDWRGCTAWQSSKTELRRMHLSVRGGCTFLPELEDRAQAVHLLTREVSLLCQR